jgi:hypothetical protein
MHPKMSQITRQEVLERKRWRYRHAGKEHKTKIIDELVELFGYHRKAAIRALRSRPERKAPFVVGRPREYDPEQLLKPLKAIWLHALQPCAVRLKAALPEWLPAYEQDHGGLEADVRESLLAASRDSFGGPRVGFCRKHVLQNIRVQSPRVTVFQNGFATDEHGCTRIWKI